MFMLRIYLQITTTPEDGDIEEPAILSPLLLFNVIDLSDHIKI